MQILIGAVIGIVVGAVVGFIVGQVMAKGKVKNLQDEAQREADNILEGAKKEGESIKKERIFEAKEKYLQLKSEFENQRNEKQNKLKEREQNIKEREKQLNQQKEEQKRQKKEVDSIRDNLQRQLDMVTHKREELEKEHQQMVDRLEKLTGMDKEEAKSMLMEQLKEEARSKSLGMMKDIIDEAKQKANKEAKKIVIQTIQRTAAEHTIENTVSVFNLNSDDQKGQIIGREGRNIRALEAATGVEIIVDDTPEAIIISGYDPVRREVARLSLQRLVSDGRIHPARIEEIVGKTRRQMDEQIQEIGERTIIDLGINNMHPQLVKMVGRMRFRSSYGQNLLQHSREVANLCATMAAELGLPPKMAKRAGLLHDIGKVPEEESELTHAILGMKMCEKYGEHPAICNAVGAHHDEVEMSYMISPLIQICDAISGARPGARRETLENYLQRIKELEDLAMTYDGVEKAFAIQAGRELRVMVESEKVADQRAEELAFEISEKIQNEMTYPGQVKVTVIRERRSVSYAK